MIKGNIVITMFFVIIALAVTMAIDSASFGSILANRFLYKNNCEYQLPPGYDIVTDGKVFVIRRMGQYMYRKFGYLELNNHCSKPLMFDTGCRAKECLRKYLEGEENKKWYKNFK